MSFVAFDIRRLDVVEGEVAAFLVTEFGHPPEKVGVDRRVPGLNADKSEPRHLRLLRARRKRPRNRRAAEQRDEFASLHSITSSARSRKDSGIVSPSALAVVRLMMRSNLVGCSTGMSPGFAPRRILSTTSAASRNTSGKLVP